MTVHNPATPGKDRTRLSKAVVLALRELMGQTRPDDKTRDLAAFIALALLEISKGIEGTASAWEKRNYWVKADRFRREWAWAERLSGELEAALREEDWGRLAQAAVQVGQKLSQVDAPRCSRFGTPWAGAYDRLRRSQGAKSSGPG